ncbi:MAG: preprotein translocase subunit SecA [Candidatus Andersenbacteria bacterium]|nr:preprotein translocase subunit SecA [Candidatus Andersenbacteria bacterium]MBI3250332.1 preprotein translocase subunit SecA [Candidatus Andersenbacteria bacterium]
MSFLSKLGFSGTSRHEKQAEKYRPRVAEITALDTKMAELSDDALKQVVMQHKGKNREELDIVVPEIFAAVREASKRTIKMRHFDVQLLGGLALLNNTISEMKTGEGKTLVATLPIIVNALTGKGAHLVTVNDYLAQRDADWMRPVYEFFGLTVGTIRAGQSSDEKRAAYAADITYGTNNEFGFDYLRDNMAQSMEQLVQRGLHFALVDEVDSILIDEARTPLIISAPDTESTDLYQQFSKLVPRLIENTHYNIDEKRRAATLTDEGISKVEELLSIDNIYADKGVRFVHHLEQALRAHTLYHRDKDYVVQEGQVIIVDEFTGRLMPGRRYSEGLHQALEAKEGVKVQQESRTLASITFQNYFRLYKHLAGMTGTAETSAEEFEKVYNLDVAIIPTNQNMVRQDKADKIFISESAKYKAVVKEIKERHQKRQPVLVGTIAIEKSEYLSALLQKEGVKHEVLNAKQHAREAEIVAQAGQAGAVTISTNMAGRGTDIKLGKEVPALGGLLVLGTERHEARRIDNQLRGRSGRQGDPGESQFYVSMDDDVMRIFGGQRIKSLMGRLKVPEDEPIENKMVSRAIESAQERVEGHYFDMRKQVLSYDDVMNRQRNAIYTLRRGLLEHGTWREPTIEEMSTHDRLESLLTEQAEQLVTTHTSEGTPEEWNIKEIAEVVQSLVGKSGADIKQKLETTRTAGQEQSVEEIQESLKKVAIDELKERLQQKQTEMGEETMKKLEVAAALRSIDTLWMEHIDTMDYLRTGIGLRGYGQRDPLVEYQKEGHRLFKQLLDTIKSSFVETVFHAEFIRQSAIPKGQAIHASTSMEDASPTDSAASPQRPATAAPGSNTLTNPNKNVGRNDPCPCGSGKKYKKCGLINAPEHRA